MYGFLPCLWRLQTHGQFGGTWLSDFVVAKSAPSVSAYGENSVRSLYPPLPMRPASLEVTERIMGGECRSYEVFDEYARLARERIIRELEQAA